MKDHQIDRLLRAASQNIDAQTETETMPFGFDTRVVALWRSGAANSNGVSRLVRRVALVASVVIVIASAGAFWEVSQSSGAWEPFTNEFAIADSAIQSEVGP